MRCERSAILDFHHTETNSYFTIATNPSPIQTQSDCVPIWSNRIRILSQFSECTSIRWIRIQSKFSPNPIRLRSHWWTRYPSPVQIQPEGRVRQCERTYTKATSTRIRFHAKTETFLFVFAFRPHANAYSVKTETFENGFESGAAFENGGTVQFVIFKRSFACGRCFHMEIYRELIYL